MAITYTWKIDMMHTQSKLGVQNAVTEIHWSKTGTDETGATGRYPGCTKFNLEEIAALSASGNFTPLNSLTETQVLTWIQATITDGIWLSSTLRFKPRLTKVKLQRLLHHSTQKISLGQLINLWHFPITQLFL
jgi:hypothetical protein